MSWARFFAWGWLLTFSGVNQLKGAVAIPPCAQYLAGRSITEVHAVAKARLKQYLTLSGAASRVHRFRSGGKRGPERVVVAVSAKTYPLFRSLFVDDFPNVIEQVVAPDLYAGYHPEPPDVFHFWFRWMTDVYDYILPDGFRSSPARMPRHGLSPLFLLSDHETRRFHDYLTLTAEPHTPLRYPHQIAGFGYPQDAYTTVGNCTGCFFHAPIGDETVNRVSVAGSLDQHGDGQGAEPRWGTLTDYPVPPEFAHQAELLKRVWNPNLHLRLMDLIGMPPEKALHAGGGWVAQSLVLLAKPERVPFVVYYTDDETRLPEPDTREHWLMKQQPGLYAHDLAISPEGDEWHIGYGILGGGFSIYAKKKGAEWNQIEGAAVRIAAGPHGETWVVNDQTQIFRRVNGQWDHVDGLAIDVGVGANGQAWVLGMNATAGGFGIYRWNGGGWDHVDGGAVRISVAPDGSPWIVNNTGAVFHRAGDQWIHVPSDPAYDIGVGANGAVWILAGHAYAGGHNAQYLKEGHWVNTGFNGVDIAVDPDGSPWLRERGGAIKHGTLLHYE